MKTIKNFLIVLSTWIVAITFGCGSKNSVKDNSGDNIHQEDRQDENFTRNDSTTLNRVDSSKENRNGNK
jgi:hypothetical protein